jgi:hypothetical protein
MGIFGKLKDAVGIGSLKAEIQLTAPGYYPGDVISGSVVLKDAASDTRVASVLLQLTHLGTNVAITEIVSENQWGDTQWEAYEKKFKVNEVVFEQFLAQDFVVTRNQRIELPFDIGTPPDMNPSDQFNKWVLKVLADLPGKMDAKATKPVKIMVGAAAPPPGYGADDDGGYGVQPPPPGPETDLPSPGERVLAFWDDAWYEATVVGVDPSGIAVTWDDGATATVSLDEVLPSESALPNPGDLSQGQRVMARFEDAFHEATVASVSPRQVGIRWDDGSESVVALDDVRLL